MARQKTKAELEEENISLRTKIEDLRGRIQDLQKEYNEKRGEIVKLEDNLRKSENEKTQLKRGLESKISQLQVQLQQKEKREEKLIETVSNLACHLGRS